jgi:hypothetical protein
VTSGQTSVSVIRTAKFIYAIDNSKVNTIMELKTIDGRKAIHSFVAVNFFSPATGLMNKTIEIGGGQSSGV